MEFSEVLAKRRSVRHFNTKLDVSDEDIRALLEAAVVAPTAGNIQPWRFTVVRSIEAREQLAEALRQRWATTAPVVIVVSVDPRPCYARYGDRGERLYAIQDSAAAASNILLTAVDRGLASCWIGAFDADAVREALGITRSHRAGRDPAGRLLGRVGRPPRAPSARRGRDLDLRRPHDVPGLGCTSLPEISRAHRRLPPLPARATRARTLVFGVGDPHARVMFVGEAPGKNEDLKGEPFVGAAGQLLNELLAHAGLERDEVYIANVLKCRPPGNRDPEPGEIETCTPFLREQIRVIEPEVLVTLGNFATKFVLQDRDRHHAAARHGCSRPDASPCCRSSTRPPRSTTARSATRCSPTSSALRELLGRTSAEQAAATPRRAPTEPGQTALF